jgi:acetyltransferase-like isoleucine patch superfamily enzyme
MRNWILMRLAGLSPFFRLKNLLLRGTGMRIGRGVALGYGVQPDLLFPHDITLEDDVTVGYGTTILCHGYLRDRYERGLVVVERGAAVGADCMILAGVQVGAGAVVAAKSLVNRDVPPGEFWGGVPAARIGSVPQRFPPLDATARGV